MPIVEHRPIAMTAGMTIDMLVRETNRALREIADRSTRNYLEGYPQVDAVVLSNTTQTVWLPPGAYVVESIVVRTSSGTASVTPRIGGVSMGVAGGVPITATTTATSYAIDSANAVEALDDVDCVVAGLGAGARVSIVLTVRRVN